MHTNDVDNKLIKNRASSATKYLEYMQADC
jgi:hypothetical protein